ncbi:GtrA family protein [Hydrogenovibrio kuenenii]|uniref:GtrA family protein n=1 Tax=Hydrogenovibrio kuenenii TaxID=63658 RepID=UPI000464D258|nr:GtrA family protein [Hydrogenovibrio kuenenii]
MLENASQVRLMFLQLYRYGLIGIALNASGYTVYLMLTNIVGIQPLVVVSILYPSSLLLSFFFNKNYTFSYKGRLWPSSKRYLIAQTLGFLLNLGMIYIFVDYLGYPHEYVQLMAIFVVALFLFVMMRHFVYKN